MRHGIADVRIGEDELAPAPRSGVVLGRGHHGPVLVRLLRPGGTRIAALGALLPAQLLVSRAAAAAFPVEIVTSRAATWEQLAQQPGIRVRGAAAAGDAARLAGQALVVHDRPDAAARGVGEVRAWQCRLEVRDASAEPAAVANADLVLVATMPERAAERVAAVFGLRREAVAGLVGMDPAACAVIRRGRIDYVALDLTSAEQHALVTRSG